MAKALEEHIGAERDGALSRYRDVLWTIRGIFKEADERNYDHG